MANTVKLTLTSDSTPGTLESTFISSDPRTALQKMSEYLQGASGGAYALTLQADVYSSSPTNATGAFNLSTAVATDTVTVEGTTLTCVDHRETTNVTFGADSSGSLNSTFLTFQDQPGTHKYYIWFNINSAGVDPAPAGRTGFQVAGATGASAATLATAAVAAAAAAAGLTVSAGAAGHIIIRNNAAGVATATADGSAPTGFTFTRSITGSAVSTSQFQVSTSDTLTAVNLAAALNANATTSLYVTAVGSTTHANLTSVLTGVDANLISISATGGIAASGTNLSGAVDGTIDQTATYTIGR